MEEQQHSKVELVVAMMPSPGMGHLIPLVEFAKRLTAGHHNLHVKFLIPTHAAPSEAQTTVFTSLPPPHRVNISHTFLPPVSLSDLPPDAKEETQTSLTILRSLPSLRRSLLFLSAPILVVDFFGTGAFDLARELHVAPYLFFPSTATVLSFALNLPRLDQEVQCEFRDLPKPLRIHGCALPVRVTDFGHSFNDRTEDAYKFVLHHAKRYTLADGIIENSFPALEPVAFEFLLKKDDQRPPVYLVGPLVNNGHDDDNAQTVARRSSCLDWLDKQPRDSVVFVCFGSNGTLRCAQINELALGLEMSEQRFLWVVKSPKAVVEGCTAFSQDVDPSRFLLL